MREIEQKDSLKKTEIVSQVEQKKEIKTIGSLRKIPGLILWKMNTKTFAITEVEPEKIDIDFAAAQKGITTTKSRVKIDENAIYCQALNLKNAERKFLKEIKRRIGI